MLCFLCVVGKVRPHPTTPLPRTESSIQCPVPSVRDLPLKSGGSGKGKHVKKGERNVNLNNLQNLDSMPRAILWFKVPRTGYTRCSWAGVGAAKWCLVGQGFEIPWNPSEGCQTPGSSSEAEISSTQLCWATPLLWCSVLCYSSPKSSWSHSHQEWGKHSSWRCGTGGEGAEYTIHQD